MINYLYILSQLEVSLLLPPGHTWVLISEQMRRNKGFDPTLSAYQCSDCFVFAEWLPITHHIISTDYADYWCFTDKSPYIEIRLQSCGHHKMKRALE